MDRQGQKERIEERDYRLSMDENKKGEQPLHDKQKIFDNSILAILQVKQPAEAYILGQLAGYW